MSQKWPINYSSYYRQGTKSSDGGDILVVKVLAGASLLGIIEIALVVSWDLGFSNSLGSSDDSGIRGACAGQNPDVLCLKEEEWLSAGINNRVVLVVSIQNAVVTGPENEQANSNFALGALALSWTLNVVYLALEELRVVNLNDAVVLKAVLCLGTFTFFEANALTSGIFVPISEVLVNIEVGLEPRLSAETKARLALYCLKEW